jgi:hypothetical protein
LAVVKREDRAYPYRWYWGEKATCRIRIYERPAYTVVIATELAENPKTSITNFAEYLATMICAQYEILPERLRWIEHHPVQGARGQFFASCDLVTFTFHPEPPPWLEEPFWNIAYRQCPALVHFTDPQWKCLTKEEMEALIGEPLAD